MSRKRLTQSERRTQIIEVAMSLFATKGFTGTTTRAIAHAAGVSEAIIFRHFATKEDLYDAIINHTLEKRAQQWSQDAGTLPDPENIEKLLLNYATTFVRRNREDATFIRLMMYSALEDHKFRQKFFAINRSPNIRTIREAIQIGIDRGLFRPVDASSTVRSFFYALFQYCISRFVARHEIGEPEQDEAMIENLVSVFLHGLQREKSHKAPVSDESV